VHLPFEGSRGCWWGEKSKCMFCGLNGHSTNYRARPGSQVLSTIVSQSEKYGCFTLLAADNALCAGHFDDLIPALVAHRKKRPLRLFCELKVNLSRKKVAALADAGFLSLKPGIESLCTRHLRLMRKGTRRIQNIYFLKLCREYGITPFWHHMVGIPGEQPDDYARLEKLIPLIVHLQPPRTGTVLEIQLHRFSAYFDNPKWTRDIRPKSWYYFQFPADRIDLKRVAYVFDVQWWDTLSSSAYQGFKEGIEQWFRAWSRDGIQPCLLMKPNTGEDGLEIRDTRFNGESAVLNLSGLQATVYRLLRDPCSIKKIMLRLQKREIRRPLKQEQVQAILDSFLENKLAVREGKLYLGLALDIHAPETASCKEMERTLTCPA
jgi:ribosomal peptide maturation radical SAM protein 1